MRIDARVERRKEVLYIAGLIIARPVALELSEQSVSDTLQDRTPPTVACLDRLGKHPQGVRLRLLGKRQ